MSKKIIILNGSPCVQRDDMEKIYPVYKEADIVVPASPLYYWSISGQLKTAFDRPELAEAYELGKTIS